MDGCVVRGVVRVADETNAVAVIFVIVDVFVVFEMDMMVLAVGSGGAGLINGGFRLVFQLEIELLVLVIHILGERFQSSIVNVVLCDASIDWVVCFPAACARRVSAPGR